MARRRNGRNTTRSARRGTVYRDELHRSIRRCLPNRGLALQVKDRRIMWAPRLLVTCAILWVWSGAHTLKDRFADARCRTIEMYDSRRRPGRSYQGFISALCSVSEQLTELLCRTLREIVREIAADHWEVDGWLAFGADGTKVECPMTAANEQAFGCAGKNKSAPQQFLTMLLHLGTGLPWAFKRGPARSSERAHLREMIELMPPGSMLVADAGFTGYDLLNELLQAGHSFVIRVGSNVRLLKKLGYAVREFEGLVYLWPQDKRRKAPLALRLVTLHNGKHPVHLLTNVLEERALPERTMARLYKLRWDVEVYYRTLKQTLGRRKMLSDAPAQARVELDWSVIGLWMLGITSVEALIASGKSPARCSAAQALRVMREAMSRMKQCCRQGAVVRALRHAVKDQYVRRSSKTARNYPRKKTMRPPGSPEIRIADETEVQLAQQFRKKQEADRLVA